MRTRRKETITAYSNLKLGIIGCEGPMEFHWLADKVLRNHRDGESAGDNEGEELRGDGRSIPETHSRIASSSEQAAGRTSSSDNDIFSA